MRYKTQSADQMSPLQTKDMLSCYISLCCSFFGFSFSISCDTYASVHLFQNSFEVLQVFFSRDVYICCICCLFSDPSGKQKTSHFSLCFFYLPAGERKLIHPTLTGRTRNNAVTVAADFLTHLTANIQLYFSKLAFLI